jgi:hypothetical protein
VSARAPRAPFSLSLSSLSLNPPPPHTHTRRPWTSCLPITAMARGCSGARELGTYAGRCSTKSSCRLRQTRRCSYAPQLTARVSMPVACVAGGCFPSPSPPPPPTPTHMNTNFRCCFLTGHHRGWGRVLRAAAVRKGHQVSVHSEGEERGRGGGSGRGCATRREALHTSLGPESHLLGYQRCSHVVLCDATRVGLGE